MITYNRNNINTNIITITVIMIIIVMIVNRIILIFPSRYSMGGVDPTIVFDAMLDSISDEIRQMAAPQDAAASRSAFSVVRLRRYFSPAFCLEGLFPDW